MGGQLVGSHTTRTYVYLNAGAERALEQAGQVEEGQFYEVLNCLVLSAFTVEAYLNHLVDHAEEFEIALSLTGKRPTVWDKYRALSKALGLQKQELEEAYPAVAQLLQFRNTMAHGRTVTRHFDERTESDDAPPTPQSAYPDWQSYAVLDTAKSVLPQVDTMIRELHAASGQGKFPFSSLGSGLFSFRPDRPE